MFKETLRLKILTKAIYNVLYKHYCYNVPRANGKITWCRRYKLSM